MKNFLRTSFVLFITVISFNCSQENQVPDDLVVRDFTWKGLNAYYLYQDEIEDLSDRRFNSDQEINTFLSTFSDETELFSSLLITSDTKSTLIPDYTILNEVLPRTSFTNGLEFGLVKEQDSDTIIGYILDILPLSYASNQSISRADYFTAIVNIDNDTINLSKENYEELLLNYSQDTLKLLMVDYDGIDVTLNNNKIALVKEDYNYNAINFQNTITDNGNTIGYLMYNNDFSKNYLSDLNNTFSSFKSQSINQLVLDLRYNIGGGSFAKNMAQIASMITGQFTDATLIKEEWNVKAQPWFLANQPDSLLTKFPTQLNGTSAINSINLTDVYIILNGDNYRGSSAIELLINSLNSHINVHLIGNQTSGNNTGSITLYNSEDYNFANRNLAHSVALQPTVLRFLNNNDETYENGFTPNIVLCENEDILNLGTLGEASDIILNQVLAYISTGSPGINATCNLNNFEYLYNSIDSQREIDNGIFIKQQLPNTN